MFLMAQGRSRIAYLSILLASSPNRLVPMRYAMLAGKKAMPIETITDWQMRGRRGFWKRAFICFLINN